MENSRTSKSIRNSIVAIFEEGATSILQFICRTVFIYTLGKEYLGYNGLFSDILTLLSLTELGVSTAIIYSMYKPAAEQNFKKLSALLNIYKKLYNTIGIIIAIVGLCLTPFLGFFISGISISNEVIVIYLLYLLNSVVSYFFVYKKSILITDQKNYIISIIYILSIGVQNLLQIIFLLITKSFIVYLIIQVLCTFGNNLATSIYVDKHYPWLKEYKKEKLDKKSKENIKKNIKAMFVSKLSSAVVTSTDNILISKFVSTIVLGIYSNYTLFTSLIRTIFGKIFEALTGSIGNLVVLETKEHVYSTFKKIWFVNFWLISFSSVSLFVCINPFIQLWAGKGYLLSMDIVIIVCVNLYMRFIRNTFLTFLDTYGLFQELRWKCIFEAVINFAVSLILVVPLKLGVFGVLLGTFISNISTNFWYEPYLIYVKKFKVPLKEYFKQFSVYFVVTVLTGLFLSIICNIITVFGGWINLIIRVVVCVICINLIYVSIFHKTYEFAYLKEIISKKIHRK